MCAMYLAEPSYDLQQGDVVLAPIAWVESSTQPPGRVPWGDFGAERLGANPELTLPAYDVPTGYAPVVVVSHDCQMDKEMNAEFNRLRRSNPRMSMAAAREEVESDPDLDRFVVVAPIAPESRVRGDAAARARGEVLGHFPMEADQQFGIEGGVADLTQLSTIDRMLVVGRLASMDDDHRARLRLMLARLFAFRTPELGLEVEAAVGRRILSVRRVPGSPLEIDLDLQGGSTVRLILRPEEPSAGGPRRRARR